MSAAIEDRDFEGDMRADQGTEDRQRVLDAVHRCVDLLVRTAIIDKAGSRPGRHGNWVPTGPWESSLDGAPSMTAMPGWCGL